MNDSHSNTIRREKRRFDPEIRKQLKGVCELTDDVIDELEQQALHPQSPPSLYHKPLTAKEKRQAIARLKKSVAECRQTLEELPLELEKEFMWLDLDFILNGRYRLVRELQHLQEVAEKLALPLDKAGNKRNYRYENTVKIVARILIEHGIQPSKRGDQFHEIVRNVFITEGIPETAVRTSIENSWRSIEQMQIEMELGPNSRPEYILDLELTKEMAAFPDFVPEEPD